MQPSNMRVERVVCLPSGILEVEGPTCQGSLAGSMSRRDCVMNNEEQEGCNESVDGSLWCSFDPFYM